MRRECFTHFTFVSELLKFFFFFRDSFVGPREIIPKLLSLLLLAPVQVCRAVCAVCRLAVCGVCFPFFPDPDGTVYSVPDTPAPPLSVKRLINHESAPLGSDGTASGIECWLPGGLAQCDSIFVCFRFQQYHHLCLLGYTERQLANRDPPQQQQQARKKLF